MEPVSTRRQVRFTPPDAEPLEGQEQPPVYLIRVPTLLERSEVEASVVGAGVRPVGGAQIRASLRAAIERCIEEPAEYLEALDRKDAEEADAQDIALLHDAEMRVADRLPKSSVTRTYAASTREPPCRSAATLYFETGRPNRCSTAA
jgi:predicted phage gp36 major capsid-like protein